MIEALTYRIRGHARFEAAGYRPSDEVDAWKTADPIERLASGILAQGLATAAELDSIRSEAEEAVEAAIEYAQSCTDVAAEDYLAHVTS